MESPTPTLAKTRFTIVTIAAKVVDLGEKGDPHWWVNFEGSWESLYFGAAKPFTEGRRVKITFEELDD